LSTSDAEYFRLRTEWLRFKSHLYDSLTGLPTLPAVVEDIRRLLESRGSVDVVYVDLGRSGWHETKLGWAAYDEAIQDFARRLGGLRQGGALGSGDLVCLHTVRSDRFLVFLGARPRQEHGGATVREALIAALRQAVSATSGRKVLNGRVRLASGHARLRHDPMTRSERAIQQAVADAMVMSLVEREESEETHRAELAALISGNAIRTVFHPIVRLEDGSVVGHEALSRPVGEVSFDSVEEMFAFAESTDLLLDFERVCRTKAIRTAVELENRGLVFLNASTRALEDPDWGNGVVEALLGESALKPSEIVVEITERMTVAREETFQAALRSFKGKGYRIAVDDMGAGYASLQALADIEPDFLKFDVSLVRDIDKSSIKKSLLESLRTLAEKIDARVIAEGVERDEERRTLLSLGIELGQGFFFHREE